MPIDASIPLSVQPPKFASPAELLTLKDLMQRSQMQDMEIQNKNAVSQILKSPGAQQPDGTLSLQAIGQIFQRDPKTGYQYFQLNEEQKRDKDKRQQQVRELYKNVASSYVSAYNEILRTVGG